MGRTSKVERDITTSKGTYVRWYGVGWKSFDEDVIIVSNGYRNVNIKREDFLRCTTMSEFETLKIVPLSPFLESRKMSERREERNE